MATATGKIECATCKKERVAYKCLGCSQNFCMIHLTDHNRELEKQLDNIEHQRNIFLQTITEQKTHPKQQSLIKQIDEWESKSIKKIQQTAKEAKELLLEHVKRHFNYIETVLQQLTKQIKDVRQENDFNEIILNQLKEKFKQLEDQFNTPSTVSIQEDPSTFISKISVILSSDSFEDSTNINQTTDYDEYDDGQTHHIQRDNPIIIPTNNDKYAATICCHNNQLLYNDYNQTTRTHRLTFIRDIRNPTAKKTIKWNQSEITINTDDDEWIQDIIYSDKLSSYLLLNRTRLRLFNDNTIELDEFYTFNNREMKRLSCNDRFIYLIFSHNNNSYHDDGLILMNYNKEEQICKTFDNLIPYRSKRREKPLVGVISDLAVGANDRVIIGYRLELRKEVGICLFNVTNDGREWSCIKQLLLNDCWCNDVSYTPRVDWSEKLNLFILVEYITGHLIMISEEGEVQGECRFMHAANRRDSPINLTASMNDYLCVRYESSINIHKLIP